MNSSLCSRDNIGTPIVILVSIIMLLGASDMSMSSITSFTETNFSDSIDFLDFLMFPG
jgi:hypothetical protein